MMRPEVLEALLAAGATAEMIVAAVKADAAAEVAERGTHDAERRAKAAERQRRKRDRDVVTPCHASSREQSVTERDTPLPLPSSPQTPQLPTPTPENNTRSRKDRPAKPSKPVAEVDGLERIWAAANPISRGRSGRPDTSTAIITALSQGATIDAIEASVRTHCRTAGEQPKGLHRIINAQLWRDHLAASAASDVDGPVDPAVLARRFRRYADTGVWEPGWGPRPMDAAA